MGRVLFILAVLVVVGGAGAWPLSAPRPRFGPADVRALEAGGDAAAGRIVFLAGGCESCHASPGQPDRLRLGGGFELKTPFGSFYPPNISPDREDGIGDWSVGDLANALLSGVSRQGEHYYPAFPYTSYQRLTLDDVRNLAAYLRTLPPVAGRAPPHALSFPFTIRRALGLWKLLFFNKTALEPAPGRGERWRLGRWLVEGPGHCAECHSPRNLLGGIVASRRLTGAPSPDGKGKASDLTSAGLAKWSADDIVEALNSGFTPQGDALGGAMAAVVRNTAQLPPSYREAIAEYLKNLPGSDAPLGPPRPTP